jgi:DNA-binding NtrC family response regulator
MAANTSSKTSLFIVEDDEAWVANLTAKLKSSYAISSFATGEEALEQLQAHKPSIIILDYHLEGELSGLDTLKEIRNRLPNAKVVFFSGQDDIQTALNILNSGAYDYVVKGENALNRLKIILRNIESREQLEQEVVELRFRVRRDRLALGGVVVLIFVISFIVFLNTCPPTRPFMTEWDPFNIMQDGKCKYVQEQSMGGSMNEK